MKGARVRVAALMVLGFAAGAAPGGNALHYPNRVSVVLPLSSSRFPAGDGAEIADAQCLMCHSTGMVLRQPAQTAAQWTATINKMRNVYGAPMPEGQIAALSSYLADLSPNAMLQEERPAAAQPRARAVDGAAIFQARCAPCHQAAGNGVPGAFPPLAGSPWVTGSEATLVKIALKGIQGPLTVKEASYLGAMPSFARELNDHELAAVLTYVRGQWGNSAGPIDAALVKSVRATTPTLTSPWHGDADLKSLERK